MRNKTTYQIIDPAIDVMTVIAQGPLPVAHTPIIINHSNEQYGDWPTLYADIITNGLSTESWFEWGKATSYDRQSPHQFFNGNDMRISLNDTMQNVEENSVYFYRTVVKTSNGTIYSYPQSIMVSSVTNVENDSKLPKHFALHQNYPNPFNPSTVITYDLPRTSHVILKIYNVLGQELKTLVNRNEEPGVRSVTFDASNFGNGIYFYKLTAEGFTEVKKMIIMK